MVARAAIHISTWLSYTYCIHIFIRKVECSGNIYFSIGVYYDVTSAKFVKVPQWHLISPPRLALRDDIGNQCQRDAIEK